MRNSIYAAAEQICFSFSTLKLKLRKRSHYFLLKGNGKLPRELKKKKA